MRDFPQRLLKKNHAVGMPSRMLYLDTETKWSVKETEKHHRMKMAWTCYVQRRTESTPNTEQWRYWNNAHSLCKFIDHLAKDKTKLYLFGHNIFFDLQASDFFHYFTKWGWVLDFTYDKGLTYILKIHQDKRNITILSTTNFYPLSLAKMGEAVGIPKIDVDFDTSTEDELITYCKQDVLITKAIMEKWYSFILKHDLGNFAMSKAGQSFKAYRHRFMDEKIALHNEPDIVELERKAYMGGRVECNFIGQPKGGPFVSLDINSMYPFVMRNKMYPTRLIDYLEEPDLSKLRYILSRWLVVAEVQLETDHPAYAVKKDGQVIFPIGSFPAFLCTPGVEYALKHGHLKSITKLAIYEKANIFTSYVDYFYALKNQYKQDDDETMTMISKHFLNNLYGKFAQTAPLIEEEEDITFDGYYREETLDAVTGKTETVTKLFNKLYIQFGTEPAKTSFAAIAAHVTEYARLYLWEIIRATGPHRILYMDTDSLKIRKSDLGHIRHPIDEYTLGALKIEEETDKLIIHAPKDYETDQGRVLKGVPANAKQIDETTFVFDHFPKQSTHLRRQITRFFIMYPMTKRLKREYKKGTVLPSGIVIPLSLSS